MFLSYFPPADACMASCGGGVIMMSSSVQRRGHYVVMDRLRRLGWDHPRDNRVLECTLPPLEMETKVPEHFTIAVTAPSRAFICLKVPTNSILNVKALEGSFKQKSAF